MNNLTPQSVQWTTYKVGSSTTATVYGYKLPACKLFVGHYSVTTGGALTANNDYDCGVMPLKPKTGSNTVVIRHDSGTGIGTLQIGQNGNARFFCTQNIPSVVGITGTIVYFYE